MDKKLLIARTGSARYGYETSRSDKDFFILTPNTVGNTVNEDTATDFFSWSVSHVKYYWGHPLLQASIVAECTGDENLVSFLQNRRHEITYSDPQKTADFGLDYIAVGERYKFKSPIKAGLRTAMILLHMAKELDDPFILSGEEKAILIRARTGEVPPEERMAIYRRTISPANIDKLRRMPRDTKVRDEFFLLLDKICKKEGA